jgi:uncharacterized FAD-dependent dehydrogenase
MKKYDVVIIGGGPAGIFAAWEITRTSGLSVLLVEKGRDIKNRRCPLAQKLSRCVYCKPCSIVSGWGGAGAFSDGKLTLTTKFGGWLDEVLGEKTLADFISYVDQIYLDFGATRTVFGLDQDRVTEIKRQAAAADLSLIPAKVRHLGTEKCFEILSRMREALDSRVEIRTETMVQQILSENGKVTGVLLEDGEAIMAEAVVAVPGREGAEWFAKEASRIGLALRNNPVDIGVRVEVPAPVLSHITDVVYESKFLYYSKSFDDLVRTFCMNPHGEVVVENNSGLLTVNGHSYAERTTDNTNFALLVSKTFTEPFKEPISYGKYIATLANMLGGGVIVQRLGDLMSGRRSTPERIKRGLVTPTLTDATPGDLSLVLPYRHVTALIEMLQALDKVAPGVASRHTLLYGVEVKFYSARVELSEKLETNIENLFAGGDGAGVTRGLAQASVAGVVMAREIINRLK